MKSVAFSICLFFLVSLSSCFVLFIVADLNAQILLNFMSKTNGKSSSCFSVGWNSIQSNPCSDSWTGVTCDSANTTVLALSLSSSEECGPNGTLDAGTDLWRLGSLQTLDISGFRRRIDLRGNLHDLHLDKLINLTRISFANCNFSGTLPSAWRSLTSLSTLNLDSNALLTGDLPSEWSELRALFDLSLGSCNFTGSLPDSWSALSNIFSISLVNNPLLSGSIPEAWSSLTTLSQFHVGLCNISGRLPSSWSSLTNLQTFYAYENPLLTGPLPPSWANMTSMMLFSLDSCNLTGTLPAAYSNWTYLSWFSMRRNPYLSGPLPSEYSAWFQASRIDLRQCNLSGVLPSTWSAMSQVISLKLSSNQLEGPIPVEWSEMSMLCMLDLHGNSLNGSLIGFTWMLYELDLSHNKFSGTLPANWGTTLYRMKTVNLGSNLLEGSIPAEWGLMTEIETLILTENYLVGEIPTSFVNLTSLITLDLSKNCIRPNGAVVFQLMHKWIQRGVIQILDLTPRCLLAEMTQPALALANNETMSTPYLFRRANPSADLTQPHYNTPEEYCAVNFGLAGNSQCSMFELLPMLIPTTTQRTATILFRCHQRGSLYEQVLNFRDACISGLYNPQLECFADSLGSVPCEVTLASDKQRLPKPPSWHNVTAQIPFLPLYQMYFSGAVDAKFLYGAFYDFRFISPSISGMAHLRRDTSQHLYFRVLGVNSKAASLSRSQPLVRRVRLSLCAMELTPLLLEPFQRGARRILFFHCTNAHARFRSDVGSRRQMLVLR
jgi:hypothetical protein